MVKTLRKNFRKKTRQKISKAIVHIQASLNNTIISITDISGQVICWSSSGSCGFKGARKSTPFAAQMAAETVARDAYEKGIRQVEILITGPGSGRETAIRGISQVGLGILCLRDRTPIPHNGCRPPKKRRV